MTASTVNQVAIVGAGPYGLAVTSFLRAAGIETHTFGRSMAFWESQMPVGMCLRSSWDASHIADPRDELTLDRYQAASGVELTRPLPLSDFVKYGRWVQKAVVPDLDAREVVNIERDGAGFRLRLDDEDVTTASRVIVATGLAHFAHRPRQFNDLPPDLVAHASEHRDLSRFRGHQVVVIGGGQSAIESAVLLSEAGAQVEVISRAPTVRWLSRSGWLHRRTGVLSRMLYPPSDVGPPVLNQIVARPGLFNLLPRDVRAWVAYRAIRPAASGWLRPRFSQVRLTTGCWTSEAYAIDKHVSLVLNDRTKRFVDHVLLATGYRVDVGQHPILGESILASLDRAHGYPILRTGFESSVPGLHFVGAAAAWSYGPLFRFVSGTGYAADAVTRQVKRRGADQPVR